MASQATALSAIAGRYAAALFGLADERKRLDEVARDLGELKSMLSESADLRRLVSSPVISREEQGQAMAALLEKAGASGLTRNFIGLVTRNRRLFALPAMIAAYLAELARRRGEVTVQVTAASALTDEQMKTLTQALRQVVGRKVTIDLKVAPALLGGLVVQMESRLFDSSLRSKLQKLARAMKGVG